MAGKQIVWDKTSERLYRTGVDRVVLTPAGHTVGSPVLNAPESPVATVYLYTTTDYGNHCRIPSVIINNTLFNFRGQS